MITASCARDFDQGLTRLEKLLYFILVAVSNQDGVSFCSDARLVELLDTRFSHELEAARSELVARGLIAYEVGVYPMRSPYALINCGAVANFDFIHAFSLDQWPTTRYR